MLVTNFLMRLVKHKIFKYLKFIKKKIMILSFKEILNNNKECVKRKLALESG